MSARPGNYRTELPLSGALLSWHGVRRCVGEGGTTDRVGGIWIEILAEALPPDVQLVYIIAMT